MSVMSHRFAFAGCTAEDNNKCISSPDRLQDAIDHQAVHSGMPYLVR